MHGKQYIKMRTRRPDGRRKDYLDMYRPGLVFLCARLLWIELETETTTRNGYYNLRWPRRTTVSSLIICNGLRDARSKDAKSRFYDAKSRFYDAMS